MSARPVTARPVVIVDPFSSGAMLAPAFARRGHPSVAVLSAPTPVADHPGVLAAEDFQLVRTYSPALVDELRELDPIGVVAGAEDGVETADVLANALTPHRANDLARSRARRHKGLMHEAVARAGLPVLRGTHAGDPAEVERWLASADGARGALVVKPVAATGTDNVHYVAPGGDWRGAVELVLGSRNKVLGSVNEAVVVQEFARGVEYAVDTVSHDGVHVLTNVLRYRKRTVNGRMAVWDHVEFVPNEHAELVEYTFGVLDALGIRWGAAHTEVIMTAAGPRLVETGARMCGGPQPVFCRESTGSSQVERLVELLVDGRVRTGDYVHRRCVVPIFLVAPNAGVVGNVEVLDRLAGLDTYFTRFIRHRNGDRVPRTVDLHTVFGIVALSGADRDAVLADYRRVREVEKQLVITDG